MDFVFSHVRKGEKMINITYIITQYIQIITKRHIST